jgi:replicative DNA helicase
MAFCKKIGGVKVLIELKSNPNLVYLEEYLRLVKDKFIRRSIKLGYEAINSGYITNIPLENMLNDFENKLLTMKLRHKLFSSRIT